MSTKHKYIGAMAFLFKKCFFFNLSSELGLHAHISKAHSVDTAHS